jgi:hypothetical protein
MIFRKIVLFLLFISALYGGNRDKSVEFFFTPQYIDSQVLNFDNGAKADIDSGFGFGFGFGYNFNPYFEVGVLFSYADADYTAYYKDKNGDDTTSRHSVYTSGINFLATYNILKGDITPFVSINGGWTYTDTGIDNGEDYYYCDPYYPYGYCGIYNGTHSDNSFNYGASVGMRFDFKRWFLKASYGKNVIDYDRTNDAKFDIYQVVIGSVF